MDICKREALLIQGFGTDSVVETIKPLTTKKRLEKRVRVKKVSSNRFNAPVYYRTVGQASIFFLPIL
jgi:hypothetical protein